MEKWNILIVNNQKEKKVKVGSLWINQKVSVGHGFLYFGQRFCNLRNPSCPGVDAQKVMAEWMSTWMKEDIIEAMDS